MIVGSVTRDGSASIAESLRQMIEEGTDALLEATISIGVAHNETVQCVDLILKRVDESLYAAKNLSATMRCCISAPPRCSVALMSCSCTMTS